ncbi:hypothetical protein VNO77_20659 [Canavalia gladiata]|uniref:PRA1 family protein n=1 Tax=Canavalia gladiata TaxID=3824 RepID=A0AAN9LT60_CANGL
MASPSPSPSPSPSAAPAHVPAAVPAAAPAPAVLPISNPQMTTSTESSQAAPTAFRALMNHLSDSLRHGLSQRRPWSELSDRTAFSKPLSFSEATLRIRHNVSYFRINYYVVVSLVLAISLLSNPFSLFLLFALLGSWLFLYLLRPSAQPLFLFGRTFSDFETLCLLAGTTFVLLFFTSLGSLLINAFALSLVLVAAHAAFRLPEDLFLDERDTSQPAGFFSILNAAAAARG